MRRIALAVLACVFLQWSVASDQGLHPALPLLTAQQRAVQTLKRFFAAYNRRDVPAVMGLLTANVGYGDCDYATHQLVDLPRSMVRAWIRARFREDDRIVPHLANADVGVTYHAVVVEFSTTRSSVPFSRLLRAGLVDQIAFKVYLNRSGTKISHPAMSAQTFCAAGLPVPGSHPELETALVQSFVNDYNAHDLLATLGLLSDAVQYGDCTPTRLVGKASVGELLGQQFASGGHIDSVRIVTTSWMSQPPNNPLTVRVLGSRTLSTGGGQSATQPLNLTILPTSDIAQIAGLSNSSCPSTTSSTAH